MPCTMACLVRTRSRKSGHAWSWENVLGECCLPAGRQGAIGLADSKVRAPPPGREHHRREDREIWRIQARQHGVDLGVRNHPLATASLRTWA
jgi:hypothetical protein